MNLQVLRSTAVAYIKRGYQAMGAAIDRPSASSTVNVSSVTTTSFAIARPVSTTEELIPGFSQSILILTDKSADLPQLRPRKTFTAFQPNWLEPEFCFAVIPFYVNVDRFGTVASIEEEPIRSAAKDSRHSGMLRRPDFMHNGGANSYLFSTSSRFINSFASIVQAASVAASKF